MEGCLLIGGRAPDKKLLGNRIDGCELVMAADSGLGHARRLGLEPTDIVGDFDSIDDSVLEGFGSIRRHRHSAEKDDTDTELGISLLREMGAQTVHLVGGGGGRIDHLFAILSLFYRPSAPDHWYTHKEHILHIRKGLKLPLPEGKRVSLFPVGAEPCRMRSAGFKWPLDELEWTVGDFGISNIAIAPVVELEMESGRLIMVYDLAQEDRL